MYRNVIIILFLLSSCEVFEDKGKKAIDICQKAKVQLETDNMWGLLELQMLGLSSDATWLDYANMLAQNDISKRLEWSTTTADTDGVYLVSFADEGGWGHRWEVAIEQKIVKHINSNEYLSRKYGLSRLSDSEDFTIGEPEIDTLKFYKKYRNSEPTIIYEYHGSVVNNSNRLITKSEVRGKLNLIFEEKTITENSVASDGFITTISKKSPWKPGEKRRFKLRTNGIEALYAEYDPPFVFFEVELIAQDPIGYYFDENIQEIELSKKWKDLKE